MEKASQILHIKSDLDAELADIVKRDVGVLNVAFANMRCSYMLPCTLPAFQRLHPNVKVNVYEGNSDENDRRLLDGQVGLAFYSKPSEINPLIEYETLGVEELLICTAQGHPISRFARPNPASAYPKLELSALKNEVILMMQPEQRTRQIVDSFLHEQGIRFRNVIYTSNLQAIMELVAIGYGVAFIFETHLRHRVQTQPIERYSFGNPKMLSDFVAAYRKGSYLPRYALDFIEIARQSVVSSESQEKPSLCKRRKRAGKTKSSDKFHKTYRNFPKRTRFSSVRPYSFLRQRQRLTYTSGIVDEAIRAGLENARKKTHPRKTDLYDIFRAVPYVVRGGIQWRTLPANLPKWQLY